MSTPPGPYHLPPPEPLDWYIAPRVTRHPDNADEYPVVVIERLGYPPIYLTPGNAAWLAQRLVDAAINLEMRADQIDAAADDVIAAAEDMLNDTAE